MIEAENLSFQAGTFCVEDVSLHVEDGEYFVLMGATGSGKSLLVKCLCGLVRAETGRILIDGRDVADLAPRDRCVGYLPQEYALFPHLSVARNITFARRARGDSHAKALRDARPVVETLGLAALLDRRPETLSGGEQQRVALARALASRPRLLVLDEPVSALDEPTRREVCEELRRVQRQFRLATIHICHNTEEARILADRVGVMDSGRLVQSGTLDELRARPANHAVARLLNVPA
jgi:ABC-type sugar transport system ATPase subunit